MTAVANPPSFANVNRPAWGSGGQSLNNLNSLNNANHHDDVRSMFAPRNKSMQRTNSSSSIASTTSNASSNASSASSAYTVVSSNGSSSSAAVNNGGPVGGGGGSGVSTPASDANGVPIPTLRKRPLQQQKGHWSANGSNNNNNNNNHKQPDGQQPDFMRGAAAARQQMSGLHPGGPNGMMVSSLHQLPPSIAGGHQSAAAAAAAASAGNNGLNGVNGVGGPNGLNGFRSSAGNNDAAAAAAAMQQGGQQPVLYLLSLNGTFDRKTITVPFVPDTLRIGRQTNKSTAPSTVNGYFDSKVLSRQHAEIWADRQGKIWIRDIKSSNGTFVNGTRLSAENRESEPHELQTSDHLELGIDIVSEDQKSVVHHKVAAKVEHAGFVSAANNSLLDMSYGDLDPANGALMLGGGGGGGLGGLGGVGGGTSLNGMGGLGGAGGPFRGRTGSQASLGPAGRMAPTSGMGGGAAAAARAVVHGAVHRGDR
ncbi:cytoplasm to vacuole targeting protein [Niveomyces insectorum RCEF 264]|uniref:Cytoplasm to vacuole targeting protein n=1 Tax=Niveomyces insectorum RCEF 264 TaxID=1081102 RepID=A0A167TAS4_9HYPO|nr:cytoplasm to vacuole targeting protein [Niveomyces insectorum RCEF 264]